MANERIAYWPKVSFLLLRCNLGKCWIKSDPSSSHIMQLCSLHTTPAAFLSLHSWGQSTTSYPHTGLQPCLLWGCFPVPSVVSLVNEAVTNLMLIVTVRKIIHSDEIIDTAILQILHPCLATQFRTKQVDYWLRILWYADMFKSWNKDMAD